jgi:hypothetical protein
MGYLISTLSVGLLAVVGWSNARKDALLTVCLLTGAANSIIGMFCRWLSYELENAWKKDSLSRSQRCGRSGRRRAVAWGISTLCVSP